MQRVKSEAHLSNLSKGIKSMALSVLSMGLGVCRWTLFSARLCRALCGSHSTGTISCAFKMYCCFPALLLGCVSLKAKVSREIPVYGVV